MDKNAIRLSKEAEEQICGAFLEIAAQLEWLAQDHNAMASPVTGEYIGLDHDYWADAAEQFDTVEHARQLYLAGKYQLAIDVLPEF